MTSLVAVALLGIVALVLQDVRHRAAQRALRLEIREYKADLTLLRQKLEDALSSLRPGEYTQRQAEREMRDAGNAPVAESGVTPNHQHGMQRFYRG